MLKNEKDREEINKIFAHQYQSNRNRRFLPQQKRILYWYIYRQCMYYRTVCLLLVRTILISFCIKNKIASKTKRKHMYVDVTYNSITSNYKL